METGRLLAKLKVYGSVNIIPPICSFVRELAVQEGLSETEAKKIELVAEEACLNVIQHALKGSQDRYYEISLENRPGQFVLAIQDEGAPIDWKKVESGEDIGLGMRLIKSYTDRVQFINLGKGGKRLEFIKHFTLPVGHGNAHIEGTEFEAGAPEMAPMDIPIDFCRVTEADLVPLIRCMYRVYGYTYKDVVYYPEKMKELMDSGLLVSVIGVTPDGEVVAHQGLKKPEQNAGIAEVTMGVVDPRFRGRRLFERIKEHSFEDVKKEGIFGLFVEMVANHPYSQKANLALGSRETGLMLGYVPPERVFHGIGGQSEILERTTVVVGYTRLSPEPQRAVYAPFHHETMIRKIYEYGGFTRDIQRAREHDPTLLPVRSIVDVSSINDAKTSFLLVRSYGQDFEHLMRARLKELCLGRFECIYADLPLGDPATQLFCAVLEEMGFFFSAIMPELHDGDILRLQYLNNVTINPPNVVIVSDFASGLLAYILQCRGE